MRAAFLSRKSSSRAGATISASDRLAMLRHLSPSPSVSQIATAWPFSSSAATRLEPINPAPPVTTIMQSSGLVGSGYRGPGRGCANSGIVKPVWPKLPGFGDGVDLGLPLPLLYLLRPAFAELTRAGTPAPALSLG